MTESTSSDAPLDLLVIGAGFGGVYALYEARAHGLNVLCVEAAPRVGGTWWHNRYPGARCDVQSIDYSYAFDENLQDEWRWSERYATQPEILRYIEHVVDRFDLEPQIKLNSRVDAAEWVESAVAWKVSLATGETLTATYVMYATGALSSPLLPDIPGLDRFRGRVLSTSSWPEPAPELAGKRIGVIGTGSSAIQSVPIFAQEAERLTVFQRTANYSVPAKNEPLTEEDYEHLLADYPERRRLSFASGGGSPHAPHPKHGRDMSDDEREDVLAAAWDRGGVLFGKVFQEQYTDEQENQYAQDYAERRIREVIEDPEVAEKLIPKGLPLGSKRICTDSGYYQTFNLPHVDLIDLNEEPIVGLTETGMVAGEREVELDILVLAIGFDAFTGALTSLDIRGVDGRTLKDAWAEGPVTYLGVGVPGFPNLLMISGPGSCSVLANGVLSAEVQVRWQIELIRNLLDRGVSTVDVREDAAHKWTEHISDLAEGTIFTRTNSWYMGSNVPGKRRQFIAYSGGLGAYANLCRQITESGYEGFVLSTVSPEWAQATASVRSPVTTLPTAVGPTLSESW